MSLSEPQKSVLATLLNDPRVQLLKALLGESAQLHLVGGTIRDLLLEGEVSGDLDFASVLLPEELRPRLESAGIRCIPTGLQHQTVTALPVSGMAQVEITTFRGPGMSPKGGVRATQHITTDLSFRDFTLNAMAVNVQTGQFIDVCGGLADSTARLMRAVGEPKDRFEEDPLRILRFIRLAAQKDLHLDAATFTAAKSVVEKLNLVSIERVRDELTKILLSTKSAFGLRKIQELGTLKFFLPELEQTVGFEQNRFHHLLLFDHILEVVQGTAPRLELRLAALFHDIGKPATLSIDPVDGDRHFFKHEVVGAEMTADILRRLRYSNQLIRDVQTLVATHMRPLEAGPGGLRRLLRDTDSLYPLWRQLKEADAAACKLDLAELLGRLKTFDQAIEEVRKGPPVSPLRSLAIRGEDLMAMGISPGPIFGKILRALHERVLDEPTLNTKEKLQAIVPEVMQRLAAE